MSFHTLSHVAIHAFEHTAKLLPLLFLTYLGMEYLENRAGQKTIAVLSRTGKKGPFVGGFLGVIPQCGFSVAAANFYAGGVITVGTLVAVFLSTSDEMLPILISGKVEVKEILFIMGLKVMIAVIAGLLADYMVSKWNHGKQKGLHIQEICEREHCHCEHKSVLKPAFIHSIRIALFIFAISVVIDLIAELVGMEKLVALAGNYPVLSIFAIGLLGMIPNCAVSVAITTFYLEGVLSMGSMFAGLLACAGMGIAVLFRVNHNWKKNMLIALGIYGISVISGILIEIVRL